MKQKRTEPSLEENLIAQDSSDAKSFKSTETYIIEVHGNSNSESAESENSNLVEHLSSEHHQFEDSYSKSEISNPYNLPKVFDSEHFNDENVPSECFNPENLSCENLPEQYDLEPKIESFNCENFNPSSMSNISLDKEEIESESLKMKEDKFFFRLLPFIWQMNSL